MVNDSDHGVFPGGAAVWVSAATPRPAQSKGTRMRRKVMRTAPFRRRYGDAGVEGIDPCLPHCRGIHQDQNPLAGQGVATYSALASRRPSHASAISAADGRSSGYRGDIAQLVERVN